MKEKDGLDILMTKLNSIPTTIDITQTVNIDKIAKELQKKLNQMIKS